MNLKIKEVQLNSPQFTDTISHVISTEDAEGFEAVLRTLAKEQKEKENIRIAREQSKEIVNILHCVETDSQYDSLIDTFEFEEE